MLTEYMRRGANQNGERTSLDPQNVPRIAARRSSEDAQGRGQNCQLSRPPGGARPAHDPRRASMSVPIKPINACVGFLSTELAHGPVEVTVLEARARSAGLLAGDLAVGGARVLAHQGVGSFSRSRVRERPDLGVDS